MSTGFYLATIHPLMKKIIPWIGLLIMLGIASLSWFKKANMPIDYYLFWVYGQALHHPGTSSIYSQQAHPLISAAYRAASLRPEASDRQRNTALDRPMLEPWGTPLF